MKFEKWNFELSAIFHWWAARGWDFFDLLVQRTPKHIEKNYLLAWQIFCSVIRNRMVVEIFSLRPVAYQKSCRRTKKRFVLISFSCFLFIKIITVATDSTKSHNDPTGSMDEVFGFDIPFCGWNKALAGLPKRNDWKLVSSASNGARL